MNYCLHLLERHAGSTWLLSYNLPATKRVRQIGVVFLVILVNTTRLVSAVPAQSQAMPTTGSNTVKQSNQEINGQVTDTKGGLLTGVNVTVKGTSTGTVTDLNGKYTINVPDNSTLVFSSIGFLTQEVAVTNRTTINVVLKEDNKLLNEVVVTALGIKKEAKKLGYATAIVNTEQLATNRTANVGSSLQGKVAGLNVSTPASGPGGSSKLRIRGQSSFGGDNSPLIVVNGIPINNSTIPTGARNTENPTGGSSDGGDGLQSINQDDIESMVVLKGAAAAALYGFRAKDGAIIITTKSGAKSNGIGVSYNMNFQADNALDYTDFQYEYGQGRNGVRQASAAEAKASGTWAFGEKFDDRPTFQFDGSMQPYSPHRNRIRDFFRTGTSLTNSLGLSGGNEKGNFNFSLANTDAKGIVPNSDFHKKIVNFGLTYRFTPKLSVQVNANYSNEFNHNPPQISTQSNSIPTTIYTMANSIDVEWLRNRKDADGNELFISTFNRNNPYWVAYENSENIRRDRIFGNSSIRYQFTDWLYVQGRIGQDYYNRPADRYIPTGTYGNSIPATGFSGRYYQDATTFRERNLDFLVGGNRTFGDFGLDVTLGGNQMKQVYENLGTSVAGFYVRDLYTIGNGQVKSPFYNYRQKRVNSLYGSAEFSFKNFLFVNVTGRNDWFSTLNPNSNSYLYPSASTSFVFSEAFSSLPSWINYGKLRGAYAEVGGDTEPYADNLYYAINANPFNGVALGNVANSVSPNGGLRPLKVKEAEVGLELRILNNRVSLDFTAYRKNTVDEILNVDISNASGYSQSKVNVGKLRNQGIESLLTLTAMKSADFRWETAFNTAYNQSKVLELANGQQVFDVSAGQHLGLVSHEVGQPLGSVRGFDYKRDEQGRILVSGGKPLQGDLTNFGSAIPRWTGGWLNTFTYKGIRIFTQVDFKAGGVLFSNSNFNFLRHGLSKQSLVGREGGVVFDGVNADGSPNTTAVPADEFYDNFRGKTIATPFIYDASFIRWRTLSLSYDLARLINQPIVRGMTLTANVNNVWLIKGYVDNLDPEAQVSVSDNYQGMEYHVLPTTRSYGLNLNVRF